MSGDRYKITDQQGLHFLTFTVVDWMDIFTRPVYKDIIVDSLNYCIREKELEVFSWCLMTNHLHLICRANGSITLSEIVRDLKKFTAKSVIAVIANENESRKDWLLDRMGWRAKQDKRISNYKFWKPDNHAIYLDKLLPEMLMQKIEYIHMNPVVAAIVSEPHHYLYSSAIDYAGGKGKLQVSIA